MTHVRVKNWATYQHYKDRRPPWIKLHVHLLNDRKFMALALASRGLLMLLWILASEDDGRIPLDEDELRFRLRINTLTLDALKPLIDGGFLIPCKHPLAVDTKTLPETETETETEEIPPIAPQGAACRDILSDLNQVAGKRYRLTADVTKSIRSRLEEGFTLEDFRAVHRKKAAEWKGSPEEKYLRPSTLYRPSKFQGYLNQPERPYVKVGPTTVSPEHMHEEIPFS